MNKILSSKTTAFLLFFFLSGATYAQNGGEMTGTTISGIPAVTKSASQIMAFEKAHPTPPAFVATLRPEPDGPEPTKQDPAARPVSQFGSLTGSGTTTTTTNSSTTQANFSNFLAIWGSYATVSGRESPYTPPDNCGDVGFTTVVATANCRMKAFTKPSVTGTPATTPTGSSTTTLAANLNLDLNSFFTNASLGISGISDPHVRFDRLTGRWFIVAIDINHNTNNYLCIAVSNSEQLTTSSTFKIYYVNVSQTGGSSQDFFDYPTLGVDKTSLYVGGNMFKAGHTFSGCNMWVINKANLIAGSLTVTGFPHAKTNTDIYTPQGVQNDDPAATAGYFIGASQTAYSKLNLKRVTYSNGVPTLSADIALTTATTYSPKTVPTLNGTAIDGNDRRLCAAMIKKNKITGVADLWIAQGTLLNSSGIGGSAGDRDGAIWMEIGNLATTPGIVQGATLYDGVNPASAAVNYIYPTIALSGQGHNIMGFTSAGAAKYAQAAVAGRYRTDPAATFKAPTDFTNTTSSYNPGASRWGDYTQTVVDPLDDMTMWTFSEYAATTNAWGVRAAQLKAPAPPTPVLSTVPACGTTHVVITGTSTNNQEFFDPGTDAGGPGFNHLKVSVTGPATVTTSNVVFDNPTKIEADITVSAGAAAGTYTVTVTNPDGQTSSTTFSLAASCPAFVTTAKPALNNTTFSNQLTKIFPNPTSSNVSFEFVSSTNQRITLEVMDITGRKIMAQTVHVYQGANQKQISLSHLAAGTYIVRFKDAQNNTISEQKIIKD